ncbi:MAG TPA: 50S ribosomal protein L9 [bacterium]|nr:50S ribosomal protein L9 [bacterium]
MKVILQENVANVGEAGEVVDVADGYGRNFLIPQGKAVQATPREVKRLEAEKRVVQDRLRKAKKEADEIAKHLQSISCVIARKAGEEDKLFGSVTAQDIVDFFQEKGIEIDRKKIEMEGLIKTLGEHEVPIRLHPQLTVKITVKVVPEE